MPSPDLTEPRPNGDCPNCGLATSFAQTHRADIWPRYTASMGPQSGYARPDHHTRLHVLTCDFCKRTATFIAVWIRTDPDAREWRRIGPQKLIFPRQSPRELHEAVPDAIRSLFREASECEQVSAMRGAAGLYRAAVEALCDNQDVPSGKLYDRLEALRTTALDEHVIDDLHEARLLGNYSLHDGLAFSAEEVADVAELIVEATTVLYVQPEERRRMRDARKARRDENK